MANESPDCLYYTRDDRAGLDEMVYSDPKDKRESRVADGKLCQAIEGHDVQILEPSLEQ